ncbi:hypothetical protein SDC9_30531 [bioreactor metagenome]|uniref:Transglutaminase-like domain-containing protein n=1 Tax=bioreactor metagenome TaxID=1076179 RepID=A0A644UZR5_9ZZZZ|nr:transglutaminase-like domain-containing protein [Methanobrevibacter sp.]MEA4957536.1 transglutaminase-like domain-containing protein [Methanobrevibacter sp.]
MSIYIYIDGHSLPFNSLIIHDRIYSANTIEFLSSKRMGEMHDVRVVGDVPEFGGQLTKRKETVDGYNYECMDYTRLLHGKIKKTYNKKTGDYIIKTILKSRKLRIGNIIKTKKKHGKIVFKDVKAIDAIQQIVNLQYNDTSDFGTSNNNNNNNIVTPPHAVNGTCNKCGWTPKKKVSFVNKCPFCAKKGKLGRLKWSPKGSNKQEWTCSKCGADFCAKCGKEKINGSTVYLTKADNQVNSTSNKTKSSSKVRMEFNVSPDGIGILKKIPSKSKGYVFYPGSYSDYDLTRDASDIITVVKVYGANDKGLYSYNNQKMIAKYGYISELLFDSNIKTKARAKAKAKKLFKEKGKIEFSGTIKTAILPKMKSGMKLAFKSPYGDVDTYYSQEVTTTVDSDTAEMKIQLLDGKPANPSEWIYSKPSTNSSSNNDSSVSKIVAEKAKELKTPKACQQWIDKNIKYEGYYNYRHSPEEVMKRKMGNCMDQARLFCHMMKTLKYSCKVVCGKYCGDTEHCNAELKMNGRTIVVDTTCHKLNRL